MGIGLRPDLHPFPLWWNAWMAYAAPAPARSRLLDSERVRDAARSVGLFLAVLAALWLAWEAFRFVAEATGLRLGQFEANDRTMPHIHEILGQLFEPSRRNGPLLIEVLWDAALFTAKEAAVGFALGALVGFGLGVLLAQSGLLQRGLLPYLIASQTIPILAVAPMVVVWVNPRLPDGLKDWGAVAVIAAYLTFFPVTINTMRGLTSVDPRSLDLMRSYASSNWSVLWKLRVPAALPFIFAALKIAAPASIVGAIIGELPASIQSGLGGAILNFNQYYITQPASLWATNLIAALLGIAFFLAVLLAEKVVVHRAPEHVA
jgi:NitT/TauT family transport system permease protein